MIPCMNSFYNFFPIILVSQISFYKLKTSTLKSRCCVMLCASSFLYISLPSLHDYNVKLPNFTFCRGREQKTTTFFFSSWTLIQSFRIQLQKFANIWRIRRDGMSAIKFKVAQIHFLSDVFVAVPVVVATTTTSQRERQKSHRSR